MPEKPLVSVIICVFNAGEYLRPAVQSVLGQTYGNLEVIIVDDGSTDGCINTISDLSDSRIRRFTQANRGRPASLNRALGEVTGEFYMLQDADDISDPRRVERLLDCMLAHPQVAGVFSGYEIILGNRRLARRFSGRTIDESNACIGRFQMPAHDPTAMYRMSMARGFTYDESLRIAHAVDYTLQIGERFPLIVIPECLYSYRIHPSSITKRDPSIREREVEQVRRKACARRGVGYATAFPADGMRRPGKHERADNNLAADFIESVLDHRKAGARWGAIRTGWACSCLHPLEAHYHKALVYALAPKRMLPLLRRSRN